MENDIIPKHNKEELQKLNMKRVKQFRRSPKSIQISKNVLIKFNRVLSKFSLKPLLQKNIVCLAG